MALSSDDVRLAYRILLNREAGQSEAEGMSKRFPDMASMREIILISAEFNEKHSAILSAFNAKRAKTLMQICIPGTGASKLAQALTYEMGLMPNGTYNHGSLAEMKALATSVRRSFKFVYGDLPLQAGELLQASYRNLIVIRRPGPRIYAIYRAIQRDLDHLLHEDIVQNNLSFGEFLELALQKEALRAEIDNGQLRRMAGQYDDRRFDAPQDYVKPALYAALHPDTLLGFSEHLAVLLDKLIDLKLLSSADLVEHNPTGGDPLEVALQALTPAQAQLYSDFTQWDNYFYEMCLSILLPEQ